jgi:hypothetical protein
VSPRGPSLGRSPWPAAAWTMTAFTFVALAVAVLGSVLSRTVVLDALALWPVAALVVPAALLGLRGGRNRAIVPLVLITWLLGTVGLHLGGAENLPSAASTVSADLSGIETARLAVVIDDVSLRVAPGPFQVAPAPVGGSAGVPVVQRVSGPTATVLTVTDDPTRSPWFRFGVFDLSLTPGVIWELRVRVAHFDMDLREVEVGGGRLEAATGRVLLGNPSGDVTLEVAGNIEISVPPDAQGTALGTTRVPDGWFVEDPASPAEWTGWRIVVVSGSVRISSR